MFRKKKSSVVIVSIVFTVLALICVGCGGGQEQVDVGKEQKEQAETKGDLELRSADVVAVTSPYTIGMNEKFIPLLKERSNGRIKVTHYPAGQLGSDSGIVEGIKLGTIDFGLVGTVQSKVTEAFYLPFLFKDSEHMHRVINGEIGEKLKEKFYEETGIRMIGYVYFAPRMLTANKPIHNLEDLKGLKIRVPQMPPMIATWKALGASPTPVAFTELFTALQTGTVDAQENPFEIIYNNSFYEVQKYVMVTNHSTPVRFFIVNDDLWQSFSKEEQKMIEEIWRQTAQYIEELYKENEQEYIKKLKEKGMIFIEPNIEEFREATKDVWKDFAPEAWGEGVYEEIQKLRD